MQLSGRVTAAIEIIDDFEKRRVPLKTAIADWGRQNRYAGSKDRAWISGLCLDALRQKNTILSQMSEDSSRDLILGVLRFLWKMSVEDIEVLCADEPHGPGALQQNEREKLLQGEPDKDGDQLDIPAWLIPMMERAFGHNSSKQETLALSRRADIDLRCNSLKATPEKALQALKPVKGKAHPFVMNAARIVAPDPSERAPAVTIIPAFNKGWVEVQDIGSQIATLGAGEIKGAQVLDFCAGAGGKTLALSALMENTGQLYAYDIDGRRLKPLYARAKRAGLRNLQILAPPPANRDGSNETDVLAGLEQKMDVVFVDAPCSGAGTWRRHPDTKWRLKEGQLQRRMQEQDAVLKNSANYVKPGGHLVYVTCSVFCEENEDRLTEFLNQHKDFQYLNVIENIKKTALMSEGGLESLSWCLTPLGALRLSPHRVGSDGFFIALLRRGDDKQ